MPRLEGNCGDRLASAARELGTHGVQCLHPRLVEGNLWVLGTRGTHAGSEMVERWAPESSESSAVHFVTRWVDWCFKISPDLREKDCCMYLLEAGLSYIPMHCSLSTIVGVIHFVSA